MIISTCRVVVFGHKVAANVVDECGEECGSNVVSVVKNVVSVVKNVVDVVKNVVSVVEMW